MNATPMGDQWFSLLVKLRDTVDNPIPYLSYYPDDMHKNWQKKAKVVLARRLLADRAVELVPGIVSILRSSGPDDSPRIRSEQDGMSSKEAAITALREMGPAAYVATNDLIKVVKEDPRNAIRAVDALGRIGAPAITAIAALMSRLTTAGLADWEKRETLGAVTDILGLSRRNMDLERVLGDPSLYREYYTAIANTRMEIEPATVVLAGLLDKGLTKEEKEVIVNELCRKTKLSDAVILLLQDLEIKSPGGNGRYAARVLGERNGQ